MNPGSKSLSILPVNPKMLFGKDQMLLKIRESLAKKTNAYIDQIKAESDEKKKLELWDDYMLA